MGFPAYQALQSIVCKCSTIHYHFIALKSPMHNAHTKTYLGYFMLPFHSARIVYFSSTRTPFIFCVLLLEFPMHQHHNHQHPSAPTTTTPPSPAHFLRCANELQYLFWKQFHIEYRHTSINASLNSIHLNL